MNPLKVNTVVRRGKNESPRDVGQWAEANENGYSVSIGYGLTNNGAASSNRDFRMTGMAMGCFFGGIFLTFISLMNLFVPAEKMFQRTQVQQKPVPPEPTPPKLEPEPEPVRYEGLKIVKGGD